MSLNHEDEQALSEFIDGENDAITLIKPQSDSYYYLEGFKQTKRKLASGKECWLVTGTGEQPTQEEYTWEIF